ncbi:metallophosphoesterase, partial [Acidobacteria bacterium AH-259-G07]|nr:metallophosphoesterase [Acidobacteria bacterium AH-259-G07]
EGASVLKMSKRWFHGLRHIKAFAVVLGALLVLGPGWLNAQGKSSRVVAVGDVHGDFDSFVTLLQEAGILDSRHRWVGRNTTLVQTGDFLDRGPKAREIMDLLMALEKDARKRGGRVVVLLGNHEVMNLIGDLRYVPAEAYASFADQKSEKRRRDAYRAYRKLIELRAKTLHQPSPVWTPDLEKEWMEKHPLGFVEYRKAFGPTGKYARWLKKRPAVAQIGDTIFLHGGIHPTLASLTVKEINKRIKKEIQAFDEYKRYLVQQRLILPFFTLNEMVAAARGEVEIQKPEPVEEPWPAQDPSLHTQILNQFLDVGNWLIMHPDGPLWFRGFATWPKEEGEQHLGSLLEAYGAKHFVVGHTTQLEGIQMRFSGKVFLIDTGMLSSFYKGGQASALEIRNGRFTAIYTDQRKILLDPMSSLPVAGELGTGEELLKGKAVYLAREGSFATPATNTRVWLDPDGKSLPFRTHEQATEFLRTARVVSKRRVGKGINNPLKVLLEKDAIRMHAVFRDVHVERNVMRLGDGSIKLYFRDDAIFECAAYELGKLLGLDNVPPTVERKINKTKGTLQTWIEEAMTLKDFKKNKIQPTNKWRWIMQWQVIHLFDNLIYNEDRNQGNILIDHNEKLWMIDHTRSFRRWKELLHPEKTRYCERNLWQKLKKLDEAVVRERLKDFLHPFEINGLLKRREKLLEHIQNLIAVHGEGGVLFTLR